jgi:hypothetical protein
MPASAALPAAPNPRPPILQDIVRNRLALTEEARKFLHGGLPEVQVFKAVRQAGGVTLAELKVR